jgi:hypothetical protein
MIGFETASAGAAATAEAIPPPRRVVGAVARETEAGLRVAGLCWSALLLAACLAVTPAAAQGAIVALHCYQVGGEWDGVLTETLWIDYGANAVTERFDSVSGGSQVVGTYPAAVTATTISFEDKFEHVSEVINRTNGMMSRTCLSGCLRANPLRCVRTNERAPSVNF